MKGDATEKAEERKRFFNVGDRVVTREYDECFQKGMTGTIVSKIPDGGGYFGVQWDKRVYKGHNLRGKCSNGYGYFMRESQIDWMYDPSCKTATEVHIENYGSRPMTPNSYDWFWNDHSFYAKTYLPFDEFKSKYFYGDFEKSLKKDHYTFDSGAKNITQSTNNNTMGNLLTKFGSLFVSEPMKSFRKAGIVNDKNELTMDGGTVFMNWLLQKNGDAFNAEVVQPILAEAEKKA